MNESIINHPLSLSTVPHLFFTTNPLPSGFPRPSPPLSRRTIAFVASLSVTLANRPKSGLESSSRSRLGSASSSPSLVSRAGEGVDSIDARVVVDAVGRVRSGVARGSVIARARRRDRVGM